jgi:hypothetical protein
MQSDKVSLTITVEDKLKQAIERNANELNLSVDDYIIEAVKLKFVADVWAYIESPEGRKFERDFKAYLETPEGQKSSANLFAHRLLNSSRKGGKLHEDQTT